MLKLKHSKWLYLSLFTGFYTVYLLLTIRVENISQVGISILFGLSVFSLLSKHHNQLVYKTSLLSILTGLGLIILLCYEFTQPESIYLRGLPFVSGVAVALLASGFKGIKQYWQELMILFFLGVPSILSKLFIDISPITALGAYILLLYTGFDVSRNGVDVILPGGSVKVVYDCSGIDQMNYLLGLSVLCLTLFPIKGWIKNFYVPVLGFLLGFLSNVARVAMMVVFVSSNREAFNFWHTGEGSYFFAMIAVLVMGFIYNLLLKKDELNAF